MEELTDFLTNKWFTSLNQPLLWQKSKYQILAPPVLCALCVHQSSLKTLKTITQQVLCLLKPLVPSRNNNYKPMRIMAEHKIGKNNNCLV